MPGAAEVLFYWAQKGYLWDIFNTEKNKVNWKFENVIYDLTFAPFSVL